METEPLSLALFDFVPTIAFLVGGYFLVRLSLLVRGMGTGRMAMAGVLLIFTAGFLKATWKLLVSTGIADIHWMSEAQFMLSAPGFLALMIVTILIAQRLKQKALVPVMAMAVWKIPLLATMTLASMAVNGILTQLSFQRGARLAAVGFIIAFLCLVGMGSMASGEQTLTRQWLEEVINAVGQTGFALGTILLYRDVRSRGA